MMCPVKHTKYQPTDEDFACPKCGATPDSDEGFYSEFSPDGAEDCPMLHDDDELRCYRCDYTTSGKRFAISIAKAKNMVKCPHCKGAGLIEGAKP
jgi:hypothetical protein